MTTPAETFPLVLGVDTFGDAFWPRYLEVITRFSKIRGFAIPTRESFELKYGMVGLTNQELMTNLRLYGTRVIPRVRELLA
jgi:hypothetical protein